MEKRRPPTAFCKKHENKAENPTKRGIPRKLFGIPTLLLVLTALPAAHCRCNRHTRSDKVVGKSDTEAPDKRIADKSEEETALVQPEKADPPGTDQYAEQRNTMVSRHIEARGVKDPRILAAMRKIKRHLFVPSFMQPRAYEDRPLPIGRNQTISQPFIVAFMTMALDLEKSDKVLEIGTGSGYQVAVLAELVDEVYTIEILEPLAKQARKLLDGLGYDNIRYKIGDGYRGWPEEAPFDAIMVTASPDHIPEPLLEQLAIGGRLVIPVKNDLLRITKTEDGLKRQVLLPVRFVPMTGEAQEPR